MIIDCDLCYNIVALTTLRSVLWHEIKTNHVNKLFQFEWIIVEYLQCVSIYLM